MTDWSRDAEVALIAQIKTLLIRSIVTIASFRGFPWGSGPPGVVLGTTVLRDMLNINGKGI